MKKYFSIMVVPHDNSKMRNYKLSYVLVYAFITLLLTAVTVGIIFVFTYGKILYTAHQATLLARENSQLRERNAQIDSLRTRARPAANHEHPDQEHAGRQLVV